MSLIIPHIHDGFELDAGMDDSIENRLEYEKSMIKRSMKSTSNKEPKGMGFFEHSREEGWIKLMCPNCYCLQPVKMYKASDMLTFDNIECIADMSYMVKCPICGCRRENIILDYNIARAIQILNQKGFKTTFCCEGHGRFQPYVTFRPGFILLYKDFLPLTWNFEMYNKYTPRIYSEKRGWEDAIYELTLFAEGLPSHIDVV